MKFTQETEFVGLKYWKWKFQLTTLKHNWNFLETAIVPRNYLILPLPYITLPLHCLNRLIFNSESCINP